MGVARFTTKQIAEALRATGGLYAQAARLLEKSTGRQISRHAIEKAVKRSPELQQIKADAEEGGMDLAEAVILNHLKQNSLKAAELVVRAKGHRRGWLFTIQSNQTGLSPLEFQQRLREAAAEMRAVDGAWPTVQDGRPELAAIEFAGASAVYASVVVTG